MKMKEILIIGAGRSATALINYVLNQAKKYGWNVTIADNNLELAQKKLNAHPSGKAVKLDVLEEEVRRSLIKNSDIVVSLLPAFLHIEVAHDCIEFNKHLITASYVSKEMYDLGDEALKRNLIFMGEMGLDPGIDHMSAMEKIDQIKEQGGVIKAFRSYTGGLISPEDDNNPWRYKFTWNPRNVILAGQGTAQYLENDVYKYTPYSRLFKEHTVVDVKGMGDFEMYANRDSLLYRDIYGLENIPNILRGTLRNVGYCDAWNALIQIGLTDGSHPILNCHTLSYSEWLDGYTNISDGGTTRERIAKLIGLKPDSEVLDKLEWLGLFSDQKITIRDANPAMILENLLLRKWKLEEDDKDMIVMQHEFEYSLDGEDRILYSTLVMKGNDSEDTAMARLVGLPLGIFVKLVMLGKITAKGVNIPVMKDVYAPVLEELKEFNVVFRETEMVLA